MTNRMISLLVECSAKETVILIRKAMKIALMMLMAMMSVMLTRTMMMTMIMACTVKTPLLTT